MTKCVLIAVVFLMVGLGAGALLSQHRESRSLNADIKTMPEDTRSRAPNQSVPMDKQSQPDKLIITHVMHQMAVGAVNGKKESHLSVEPTRSNGIMAIHTPEYIANYGKPLEAARQDIALMKGADINTLALLLGNDHLPKSQFAAMIHAYYQAALEDGTMKIAPDIWGNVGEPGKLADAMGLLKEKYEPAWRRCNGKLMVSITLNDYGSPRGKRVDYRKTVDALFAKIGGRENVYLVTYDPAALRKNAPDWFQNSDAFTDWVHMSYNEDKAKLAEAMAVAKESGKPLCQPVMPSFTQSRYPHPGITPNVREMLGMSWFHYAWMAAIKSGSPMVYIQTWNDLTEDSSMMPESNHGYGFYELGKYYALWFREGKKPEVEREQILLFHHPQIVEGVKLPAGIKPMEGFPVSHGNRFDDYNGRTPPTDYVGVVAMLKAPAKVSVMLGETVLAAQEFPAGMTSWLLYHPRGLNDPRKLYPCDPDKVYPQTEADFLTTRLEKPFFDAEVFVAVERGKERIGFFRSHRPIAGAAARGDLTTIGDAFPIPTAEFSATNMEGK